MSCPRLPDEDLVAWLDGESADPAEARRVAEHVAGCAACAEHADLLRRSADLLARLPRRGPSADFADRVVAAARAPAGEAAPAGRLLRGPWSAGRAAAVAAALAVAVAGAWYASRPTGPGALSAREEEEIARDLLVLAHLETLQAADEDDLSLLADDLDVLESASELLPEGNGG